MAKGEYSLNQSVRLPPHQGCEGRGGQVTDISTRRGVVAQCDMCQQEMAPQAPLEPAAPTLQELMARQAR